MEGKRNFRLLLSQGILWGLALQISSAAVVVPYIAAELGAGKLVIALLVPLYAAGTLLGTAAAPKLLRVVTSMTVLMVGAAFLQAVLNAVNATAVSLWCVCADPSAQHRLYSYPLLLTSLLAGVIAGCGSVFYPMVLSASMSPRRRNDLLLKTAGFGAALGLVVIVAATGRLSSQEPQAQDADLLWIGTAALALATVCCLPLASRGVQLVGGPPTTLGVLREGHRHVRRQRWLRRYVLVQLIFISVRLSPMFFAIYIASTLGPDNGDLELFLIFTCSGLLIGIPAWRIVRQHLGTRGMYAVSAGLTAAAVILCAVSISWQLLPPLWSFGLVLLLAALANQGVPPAAQDWVMSRVDADTAAVTLSYSLIVVSVGTMIAGFGLGLAAEDGGAIWPLALMLSTVVVALLATFQVPRRAAEDGIGA
ncbi:MAG: hypothetical protein AB7G47_07795 [Mycolicibacterium sp.]|uniref:hypothetical protein n=1 Tax=Mycolicibacterium sp. TaxID=2320850 RepID=UPI003D0CAEC6